MKQKKDKKRQFKYVYENVTFIVTIIQSIKYIYKPKNIMKQMKQK